MKAASDAASLNALFSLDEAVRFEQGPNNFVVAKLTSDRATASLALHGAHVLSFQPENLPQPVLWLSDYAQYEEGKAIRGGIPICWPWFGPHPEDPDKPSHGFARNRTWEVFSARLINEVHPQLHLTLLDDAMTRSLWAHAFRLELIVTLSDRLALELQIQNTGDTPFTSAGALHTYLTVSHISDVRIHGLEGVSYIDQLDPGPLKVQDGAVLFDGETDNIYLDSPESCRLVDAGWRRELRVEKTGSRSTVVWNPWIDKAARMSDFGDAEYLHMVCIEAANAESDSITVAPGDTHSLGTAISASMG